MSLIRKKTTKRKVTKRKSRKIGGKRPSSRKSSIRKTRSRKASVAPTKRKYSDPYASSYPSVSEEQMPPMGMDVLGTLGPMAVSYALSQGGRIIKNYRESKEKAKAFADTINSVTKNPNFVKASKEVKDGILLFVAQSKDPYAYLKVKPADSQLYIDLVAKKKKLFAPKIQKPLIDAAVTYIKIQKSNMKDIKDLKNLIL